MSVHLIVEYTDHLMQYDVQEQTAIRVNGHQIYQFVYLNKNFSLLFFLVMERAEELRGKVAFSNKKVYLSAIIPTFRRKLNLMFSPF